VHELALEARALSKRFGKVVALDHLDFQLRPGESVALLGDAAAGKSTALRCLAGLARPTGGAALLFGVPVSSQAGMAARRRLGVLMQDPGFYGWMTTRELLAFSADLLGLERSAVADSTAATLERVGLTEVADERIGNATPARRQRLALANALLGDPEVVLLDEPLSWLEPSGRGELLDLVRAFRGTAALVVATRDVALAEATCERTIVLDGGRAIAQEPTIRLLDRAAPREYLLEAEPGPGLALAGMAARLAHESWVREVASVDSTLGVVVADQPRAERELLPAVVATGITVRSVRRERPPVGALVDRLRGDGEGPA
jgi:ABC-2 type transport system ATP-binding protein